MSASSRSSEITGALGMARLRARVNLDNGAGMSFTDHNWRHGNNSVGLHTKCGAAPRQTAVLMPFAQTEIGKGGCRGYFLWGRVRALLRVKRW